MTCYVHSGQPWFGVVPPTCTCGEASRVRAAITTFTTKPVVETLLPSFIDMSGLDEDELALVRGLVNLLRERKGKN